MAVGGEHGPGFGAPEQGIGRTAIPFLRKFIVPAAKRVGAHLLEFAAPEFAGVATGRKSFKTQLGSGSRKKTASRVISTKSAEKSVGREETF